MKEGGGFELQSATPLVATVQSELGAEKKCCSGEGAERVAHIIKLLLSVSSSLSSPPPNPSPAPFPAPVPLTPSFGRL